MTQKYRNSYYHAFKGLGRIITKERNIKIHLIVALIVLPFVIFYFKFSMVEIAVTLVVMSLVIVAEVINTLIEKILDHLHPQSHENIALIKDGGAGAVLAAALFSVLIGIILIIPHIQTTLDGIILAALVLIILSILYFGLTCWRK